MAKKMRKRANGEGSIVQKTNGSWEARISIKNPLTGAYELKTRCRTSQKEVREWLNELKAQVTRGEHLSDNKITLGEWAMTWLNEYAKNQVRATTWESYESTIRNHIIPELGGILLSDLKPSRVQQVYNQKLIAGRDGGHKGLSATSVGYIHAVLHSMLKRAVKNGLVSKNVAELVDKPKKTRHEIKPLSLEELKHFLIAIKETHHYAAYLLECYTGLRRGELLALRWQDVDFDNKKIMVCQGLVRTKEGLSFNQPKTEASRRSIPINDEVLAALKMQKRRQREQKVFLGQGYNQDKDLVFCNITGNPLDPRSFTKSFQRVLLQAGLPQIRFHDMRHTHATLLLALGENPKVVQERLGHTTIRMTLDTYSHTLPGMQESATAVLGKALAL